MPIYPTFDGAFVLTEGKQRIGIVTLMTSDSQDNISEARIIAEQVLQRFTRDEFFSLASDGLPFVETKECDGSSCTADVDHPHDVLMTYMDIDVPKLKKDLEEFVQKKLAPFVKTNNE